MAIISEVQQQDIPPETRSADAGSTEDNAEEADSKPFTGHTDGVQAIVYSPDGKFIATASLDHTVRVWDSKSGKQVGSTMGGHAKQVNAISYTPDGKSLVSGGDDGTVRLWDTENAEHVLVQALEYDKGFIMTVKYSPDGRFIASGGEDKTLRIWDLRERKLKFEYEGHPLIIRSVAWEPSGNRLATGCADRKVRVFDLMKPDVVVFLIEGHRGEVNSVTYSPDGSTLASGADDRTVRLWDAKTGKAVKSPFRGHRGWVTCVAWSPDSTRIVTGSNDTTVRVWDVNRGQSLFKGALYAHNIDIWGISYSPDGRHFASADSRSGYAPRVQVWDAQTGKALLPRLSDDEHSAFKKAAEEESEAYIQPSEPGKMKAGAAVLAAAWFPDGQRFASAGEEPLVRIWSAQTGLQIGEIAGHHETGSALSISADGIGETAGHKTVHALSISADGTRLAAASDDRILLFDIASMQPLMEPLTGHDEAVYAVKLTPDGSRVVSGSKDKTVRVWDVFTGKVQHVIEAHTDAVRALSVTKDGTKLASGGDDKSIYVWNMGTYEQLAGPFKHDGPICALSFSPDGSRLVSGSDDRTIRVWNVATGKPALDPIHVHTGPIGAVDWSQDGTKLLTAGAHDWTIWILDASTGKRLLGPLEGHDEGIRAAAFSPDGRRFTSVSVDHTLRVWDTATGAVLLPLNEESKSDKSEDTPDEPQVEAEGSKRAGVRRQASIDDSIMNMPATIGKKKLASTSKGFWDDTDFEAPSSRQGKGKGNKNKNVGESQHKANIFRRIWQRQSVRPGSKLKEKDKGKRPANTKPEEHAMTHMPRPSATKVSVARDKLRVLVAGDDPRARFPSQAEPESDEERQSPTGSTDPNQPGANSSSDDESEHGLVDTICFCLCLPCCK